MTFSGRILIVDDDPLFIDSYRDLLSREGYEIETAETPETALRKLDEANWDVVIVDQKLRHDLGSDEGLDVLAEVQIRSPGAKAIMVTAYASPESVLRAFALGAYDYLEKQGRTFSTLVRIKVGNAVESVRERRMGSLTETEREAAISRTWKAARTEVDRNRKGKLLEEAIQLLFRTIPGFHDIDSNVKNESEEVDLLIRNESVDPFWSKESSYILIECKNWSVPVGRSEIDVFRSKLERRYGRAKLGFFVAVGGFTEPAQSIQSAYCAGERLIVLLSAEDLGHLVEPGDRNRLLKEFHQRAVMSANGKHG